MKIITLEIYYEIQILLIHECLNYPSIITILATHPCASSTSPSLAGSLGGCRLRGWHMPESPADTWLSLYKYGFPAARARFSREEEEPILRERYTVLQKWGMKKKTRLHH